MNPTHVHLALTHLPIYGTLIGLVILFIGLLKNNKILKLTAMVLFTCMSIVSIPVYLSGEEAEETMEELIPDSRHAIHEHEELAEKAIWLIAILGVFSVASLIAIKTDPPYRTILHWLTFLLAFGTFTQFFFLGKLGGEIRHTEIRAVDAPTQNTDIELHEESDDDD